MLFNGTALGYLVRVLVDDAPVRDGGTVMDTTSGNAPFLKKGPKDSAHELILLGNDLLVKKTKVIHYV